MPVHFYKKPVIVAGSVAFLVILIIALFFLLYKNHTPQKEQYKSEKKQLSEIFATLDTAYWRNEERSLLLVKKAIQISKKIADSNALAEALYNKARIIQRFEINDSGFAINNQALAMAEKSHNDTLIAKIKGNIGFYYFRKGNFYLSTLYYTDVENIAAKIHDDYLMAKALAGFGSIHTEMDDYKKAVDYYERAIQKFEEMNNKGYLYDFCGVYSGIGVTYLYSNDLAKANFYEMKALEKANQLQDADRFCRIFVNLGCIDLQRGKRSSALNYFLKALNYSKQISEYSLMHGTIFQDLGVYYLYGKEYDEADKMLNQSLAVSLGRGYRNLERQNMLTLSEVKKQQKQWEKAFKYYVRFKELSDSVINVETQKKISDYQWEIKSQKKKYEEELLLKKYNIQKKRNWMLIILIISVITIALVVRKSLKKSVKLQRYQNAYLQEKMESDEKINALEKLRYQSEIEAKNKELATSSIQVVTKNDVLLAIDELADKSYKGKQIDDTTYDNLKKILKENLNLDKDWQQFKKMFEQVHQDFFIKLKQICPELTENEMRLCAYLKINLQNKEIAKILNVNPATIATNRYHIRKKLNLNKETGLENFIREI